MATIASGQQSYASVDDLTTRFDLRPLKQLLSDSNAPLPDQQTVGQQANAFLQEASGLLEAAVLVGQRYIIGPSGPPVPQNIILSSVTTGGTVPAGDYQFVYTYTNSVGEGLPSNFVTITTLGSTSLITALSPAILSIATGWNLYATQPGGNTFTLQNNTPTTLGSSVTVSATPTSGGKNPPTTPATGQNDLWAIATSGTNTGETLKGVVCALAYMMIWERRPEWLGSDPERSTWRIKLAMDTLDKLREGAWIFGTTEAAQAGEFNDTVETEQILAEQKRTTFIARPYFGPRVADIVGSNPPPDPYP